MVIEGEAVKVNTCSLIMHSRQQKGGRRSHEFIPEEIWLEILSRLPIKSLFISQSVCKLWRNLFFTLFRKIDTNPLSVPVCGLLILSFANLTKKIFSFSYFCLKNKQNFINTQDLSENNSIYSSGFDRGLLSDLSFDFSITRKVFPNNWQYSSFVLHGGLLLLTSIDCTAEVHNPATRQIYYVPKSRIVEQDGFSNHHNLEKPGLIIQLPTDSSDQKCLFMVVRFCFKLGIMEVYYSRSRTWKEYRLMLDDEFVSSTQCNFQNYAAFIEKGVLSLYALTIKRCGIATKFKGPVNTEMKQYCFPLPEVVIKEYYFRARLWECEETLYLSFYLDNGLWIWKAGSTEAETWAWVPVLEISHLTQSRMPLAYAYLSIVVRDKSVHVVPLAFHPNLPILYLVVESSVLAYNLKTDTLDTIGEIKNFDRRRLDYVHPFKPCFSLMDGSNNSKLTGTTPT